MTEEAVKLIALETVNAYEEKVGLPRHTQNLTAIGALKSSWDRARGAMIGVGIVTGMPGIAWSCIQVLKAIRGH